MTKKDFSVFIEHIFDSAEKIESYVEKITEKKFDSDIQCQDAVMKRFEIIGEATKKIPLEFRKKHPEIDWKDLTDTRNFFVHEYFGVNKKKIWKASKQRIPELKPKIEKIMEELGINRLNIK